MASLNLNPVMNVIALPFALVVSVIAATTVFRDVFVAYDGFGNSSSSRQYRASTSTSSVGNGRGGLRGGNRWSAVSSQGLTRASQMFMDDHKGQDVGHISVHRVVDISIDPLPASVTVSRTVPSARFRPHYSIEKPPARTG
jgi:hypothetical protein